MTVEIVPLYVIQARRLVKAWHRHLPEVAGGLFACGLAVDAGRPIQAQWEGLRRISISRVAVREGAVPVTVNACTRLYGAICRAAQALGWREAWTYTLAHEPGTSLRAAGFELLGATDGDTDYHSRGRRAAAEGPKKRWRRVLSTPKT